MILINSASSLLLLKTFYSFIFKTSQKENYKLDFVMSKIKKLEDENKEILLIVDTLEEKVGLFEETISILQEKVRLLELNVTNKIDTFLTSNYDIVNLSINTH